MKRLKNTKISKLLDLTVNNDIIGSILKFFKELGYEKKFFFGNYINAFDLMYG